MTFPGTFLLPSKDTSAETVCKTRDLVDDKEYMSTKRYRRVSSRVVKPTIRTEISDWRRETEIEKSQIERETLRNVTSDEDSQNQNNSVRRWTEVPWGFQTQMVREGSDSRRGTIPFHQIPGSTLLTSSFPNCRNTPDVFFFTCFLLSVLLQTAIFSMIHWKFRINSVKVRADCSVRSSRWLLDWHVLATPGGRLVKPSDSFGIGNSPSR